MVLSSPRAPRFAHLAALLSAWAVLSGCTSFSPDGGFGFVQQTATDRLGKELVMTKSDADQTLIDQRVTERLTRPLQADDAVQVALWNNRGLQAVFQELGIAEAEAVQAGRLPNPGISFGKLTRGAEIEHERGLQVSLARLLALPYTSGMEVRHFEQTKRMAATQVLALAADTRKAHVQAVAAEETLRYCHQVAQAAEASAELARRMVAAGNFNQLQQAREQGFHAEALLKLARAQQARLTTRERLARLMGVSGAHLAFELPPRLPDLPSAPVNPPDIERAALTQRLDVQQAKQAAEQTAQHLGLTHRTRFVNVLELGGVHNSSNDAPTQRGWEIRLELPLFDWGDARVARAEAVYMQSVHRAADTALQARADMREAYDHYRSAWDIARRHRDELVPLRRRIAEENLLRYNAMLIGVFELLADARLQVTSVIEAIDALRDFWLAQADLDMALIGKPSPPEGAGRPGAHP